MLAVVERDIRPDMEKPHSVVLENVCVSFNGDPSSNVLDRINLTIPAGEFVALVGKSGCGKTTILNLLAGLIEPTQGRISIHGKDAAEGREHVGYMFARDCLFPWRRAQKNVEMPLEARGLPAEERRRRARRELDRVGLGNFADYYPKSLSHGMRQRVAIARTWVLDPDILLMDEPFAALDDITRQAQNDDLLQWWLAAGSMAALFVTHSVAEAVFLSQRVLVMAARPGRVVAELAIDAPYPRPPGFRHSPAFTDACRRLGDALAAAHAAEGAPSASLATPAA